MNTSNSRALQEYLQTHSFISLTTTTSIVAVVLLLIIAIEREIIRTINPESARRNVATFAVVVIPMFLVFVTVVVTRFIKLS